MAKVIRQIFKNRKTIYAVPSKLSFDATFDKNAPNTLRGDINYGMHRKCMLPRLRRNSSGNLIGEMPGLHLYHLSDEEILKDNWTSIAIPSDFNLYRTFAWELSVRGVPFLVPYVKTEIFNTTTKAHLRFVSLPAMDGCFLIRDDIFREQRIMIENFRNVIAIPHVVNGKNVWDEDGSLSDKIEQELITITLTGLEALDWMNYCKSLVPESYDRAMLMRRDGPSIERPELKIEVGQRVFLKNNPVFSETEFVLLEKVTKSRWRLGVLSESGLTSHIFAAPEAITTTYSPPILPERVVYKPSMRL